MFDVDDDDVYYYIRWRLKLEGETENMGVCTKERKGATAAVLMATPCTNTNPRIPSKVPEISWEGFPAKFSWEFHDALGGKAKWNSLHF